MRQSLQRLALAFATASAAASPAVRVTAHLANSEVAAGTPVALEIEAHNPTDGRVYMLRDLLSSEEPLQNMGSYSVDIESVGADQPLWDECPVTMPREPQTMVVNGTEQVVREVVPIEAGETVVIHYANLGVCRDLLTAGAYRVTVRLPAAFFSPADVFQARAYYVTYRSLSEALNTRRWLTAEPMMLSITDHPDAPTFRDARKALLTNNQDRVAAVLEPARRSSSPEIRAAALFWEATAEEGRSRPDKARALYARIERELGDTIAAKASLMRTDTRKAAQPEPSH